MNNSNSPAIFFMALILFSSVFLISYLMLLGISIIGIKNLGMSEQWNLLLLVLSLMFTWLFLNSIGDKNE